MLLWAGFTGTRVPSCATPFDIDNKHSRAISQEIGERLQAYLRVEPELPANIRMQVDQLQQLEGQSPSIVPDEEHGLGNEPSK